MRAFGLTIAEGWILIYGCRRRRSYFILQAAHHFGFGDHNAVDRGVPRHLGDRTFSLDDLHLDAKLVAGAHRLAEARLIDGNQKDELFGGRECC